jgi:AhpD family alkylhydroperoxidase
MGATANKNEIFEDIQATFGQVPGWIEELPDESVGGFWSLMKDFYLAETKVPNKYKELIGIAVSGATRCKYCALFHTEGAKLHGATDQEIAEASAMGSFTMLASTFLNAQQTDYEEFREETLAIIDYVKKQSKQARGKQPKQANVPSH